MEIDKINLHYLRESVVYHNHVLGSSFSESDVVEGIENNVLEFNLLTKYYLNTIRRPVGGWNIKFDDVEVSLTYQKCQEFANSAIQALLVKNEIRNDEVDLLFNHYIWLLFFEKYEIPYQKKAI